MKSSENVQPGYRQPTSPAVLVIHGQDPAIRRLKGVMSEAGLECVEASNLETAATLLNERIALILLGTSLLDNESWQRLELFGRRCRAQDAPCYLVSSEGDAACSPASPPSWLPTPPLDPGHSHELVALAQIQLGAHRMGHELRRTRARLLQKEMELDDSMRSAGHIQQCLIPPIAPNIDGLDFAWRFLPCDKVGGDQFNVQQLDEETVMVYILDVSGHGISSAMLAVSIYQSLSIHTGRVVKRVFIRPPYYKILTPAEVLAELNIEYPFERFEMFFTISYMLINIKTGLVRYSNAGHPAPVLTRTDGSQELLTEGSTIIGMSPSTRFVDAEVQLLPGDRLFLYSDGVTDLLSPKGEFYGQERFHRSLKKLQGGSLDAICAEAVEDVNRFGGGGPQNDDITLIGIEYRP